MATTLLCAFLLLLSGATLRAQIAADRVSVGGMLDLDRFAGSLDGGFDVGGHLLVRWNIHPRFSLLGRMGAGALRFSHDADDIAAFPNYFGPTDTLFYPNGGGVLREASSRTGMTQWSIAGALNLRPNEEIVPYISAGVELLTFDPRNVEQDLELPNNQADTVYATSALAIPVGLGAEWYVTTEFVLMADLRLHLGLTDYLDDIDDGGMPDAFASLSIGAGYYVIGQLDCDDDGMNDREEKRIGTDPCVLDTDADGLEDIDEVRRRGTDPLQADTDGDGLNDYEELIRYTTNPLREDSDGDALTDGDEVRTHTTDPLKADSDADELTDGDEVLRYRTAPLKADTDADGLPDGREIALATDPLNPDSDKDQLTDGDEVLAHKTNPLALDTDADELEDGYEVMTSTTDPLSPDTDSDRLGDGAEIRTVKTDPKNPDTDGDAVIDGEDACPLVRGVRERNGCPAPPKVGTITDFPAIYFIKDSDQFDFTRGETSESLAKIMSYVNQCPGLRVMIEGHASREGTEKRNMELSDQRAARVKAWLVERGISEEKVAGIIGFGSARNAVEEPAPDSKEARNMDPAALENIRRQNRRIAVRVVRTCD